MGGQRGGPKATCCSERMSPVKLHEAWSAELDSSVKILLRLRNRPGDVGPLSLSLQRPANMT